MQNDTLPAIGWLELCTLLSPVGKNQIAEIIAIAKRDRGSGWIESIKAEYPTACWIIDLAANYTADDAYTQLRSAYPHYPLWMFESRIKEMHGFLRDQIDSPRG